MDKLLPYLLLGLLLIATWHESLSHRLRRMVNGDSPTAQVTLSDDTDTSASTPAPVAPAPTPKPVPFWQQQGYHNTLDPEQKKKTK
jgi:hypothetical protein